MSELRKLIREDWPPLLVAFVVIMLTVYLKLPMHEGPSQINSEPIPTLDMRAMATEVHEIWLQFYEPEPTPTSSPTMVVPTPTTVVQPTSTPTLLEQTPTAPMPIPSCARCEIDSDCPKSRLASNDMEREICRPCDIVGAKVCVRWWTINGDCMNHCQWAQPTVTPRPTNLITPRPTNTQSPVTPQPTNTPAVTSPMPTEQPTANPTPYPTASGDIRRTIPTIPFVWDDWGENRSCESIIGLGAPCGGLSYPADWYQVHKAQGIQDWTRLDKYALDAAAMGKPVIIGVRLWSYQLNSARTQYGISMAPPWIPGSDSHLTCSRPTGMGCKLVCTLNVHGNPELYDALVEFIQAMGKHYADPKFSNVVGVVVWAGVDGEATMYKDVPSEYSACTAPDNSPAWVKTWDSLLRVYSDSFSKQVVIWQEMLHGTIHSAPLLASLPRGNVGLKLNGWVPEDPPGAEIRLDGVLSGGLMATSKLYYDRFVTMLEPKHAWNEPYWALMSGLAMHIHTGDIQRPVWENDVLPKAKELLPFNLLDFYRAHLGVTSPTDAPNAWIILRETKQPAKEWMGSDGVWREYTGVQGDFEGWMTRLGNHPVVSKENLAKFAPRASRHTYGWYNTRSASGLMCFNVDDRYASSAPQDWHVQVTYVDVGTDQWTLRYRTANGAAFQRVNKAGTGEWVERNFLLPGASFGNWIGGADFCIDANGDGLEYVHRVVVTRGQ